MPFQKLGDAGNGRQLHLNSSGEDYLDFYEDEAFYGEVTTHAHQNLTCMGFVSICEGYGILEQLVNCFPAVLEGISQIHKDIAFFMEKASKRGFEHLAMLEWAVNSIPKLL